MKSKKKICGKKIVQKSLIEDKVFGAIVELLKDKKMVKCISERCYAMQSTESSEVPILKKQLKAVRKEIDNVMEAIKAGIITKSTKKTLTNLEEKQEAIETALAQEQICRPILTKEQIEFWILQFSKTDLTSEEQKQRLIDIFINCVYVYDDRLVVFLNFKDDEVTVSLNNASDCIKKANTQRSECSSLITYGDPYGNRIEETGFPVLPPFTRSRITKPNIDIFRIFPKQVFPSFFGAIMCKQCASPKRLTCLYKRLCVGFCKIKSNKF